MPGRRSAYRLVSAQASRRLFALKSELPQAVAEDPSSCAHALHAAGDSPDCEWSSSDATEPEALEPFAVERPGGWVVDDADRMDL